MIRLYLILVTVIVGLGVALSIGQPPEAVAALALTPTAQVCYECTESVEPEASASAEVASKPGEAKTAVVRVVLFWMATCPHCHYVLDEVLPPLQQKYGAQLEVFLIEIKSQQDWARLAQVGAAYDIPQENLAVPFMIVGGTVLIGSGQIPAELPGLIERHLSTGGIDFPLVPGLIDLLPAVVPEGQSTSTVSCAPDTPCAEATSGLPGTPTPAPILQMIIAPPADSLPGPAARQATPNGFELAIGLMAGMVAALIYVIVVVSRGLKNALPPVLPAWLELAIPLLAIVGLGIAGYLAFVETQAVAAVCGPIGDCNTVQSSPYARLFGFLPVGVLGVISYVGILVAWLWGRLRADKLAAYMPLILFGMAWFGVLFSLYLTYLEPFVIKAVCLWCLSSAVIITLLMLFSLRPALETLQAGTGKMAR